MEFENISLNFQDTNSSSDPFPLDTSLEDENMFILPWYQQLIWSLAFGIMVIVAAGGNLIVIWIVLTNRRMRTVTNYFIVNLSIADTMVSLLNVVFNFAYMLDGNWPFGEVYCKFSNFISILSVAASVFTLMAISIDRYQSCVLFLYRHLIYSRLVDQGSTKAQKCQS